MPGTVIELTSLVRNELADEFFAWSTSTCRLNRSGLELLQVSLAVVATAQSVGRTTSLA